MEPLTPLNAVLLFFGVIQLYLAGLLLWKDGSRRPAYVVSSVLFALNAAIGILVAVKQVTGITALDAWPEITIRVLDIPTNFLLILLVPILLLRSDRLGWPRWTQLGIVACVIAGAVNAGLVLWKPPAELGIQYVRAFHIVPIALAYGGLLVALAIQFSRATLDLRLQSLLLFGWGARPMQIIVQESGAFIDTVDIVNFLAHVWFAACAVACLVVVLAGCMRRQQAGRVANWWVPVGLLAAMGLGLSLRQAATPGFGYDAAQLVSLVAIRPILVGYAYLDQQFQRGLVAISATALAVVVSKAAVSLSFGTDSWALSGPDAIAIPLAGLLVWAFVAFRKKRTPPTRDSKLLDLLLDSYQKDPTRGWTSAEIAEALGIPADNVARDVDRARSRLERIEPTLEGPLLLEKVRRTRGFGYRYRLTARGAKAAMRRDLQ